MWLRVLYAVCFFALLFGIWCVASAADQEEDEITDDDLDHRHR